MQPQITDVRDHIAWSYANLARADAALRDGSAAYQRVHHMIRAKLFKGLRDGSMSMRSLYDDERFKMTGQQACFYCGAASNLTMDHVIPRIRGGRDDGGNLVWACKSCNSSKGCKDMLAWMQGRGEFPPLMLLRRHLKLVSHYCEEHQLWLTTVAEAKRLDLPFDLDFIPLSFPPLDELKLFV